MTLIMYILRLISGADPGFQVRGPDLKKIAPSGGGREIFGVFRVKNHDFTPKKICFQILWGGGGGGAGCPPWIRPWGINSEIY